MGFLWEVRRGVSVLEQVKDPGVPLVDTLHSAIQWRVFFPMLGRGLGLPAWALFGLAHLGAALVVWSAVTRARRSGAAWWESAALALGATAAGWFFATTGWLGYYDAWVVLGLVTIGFAPRRELVWVACLLAPWIDERFVLAVPLALLCRHRDGGAERRAAWKTEWGVPLALVGAFTLVRLMVLSGSAANATVAGYFAWLDFSKTPWWRFPWGIWEGSRVGWVLAGLGLWSVARRDGPRAAWLLGGVLAAVVVVGVLTAQDFSRAMLLAAPVVWLGIGAWGEVRWRQKTAGLATLAVVALVLPAHQVMSDSAEPVLPLVHELVALREPPPRLAPATYEVRGIVAMERGQPQQAEVALTLAIKLDPAPTSACKHRGLLYASAQRWAEALRDFRLWTTYAPTDPDAWLLVAQAEGALGNTEGAKTELRKALGLAPKAWATRPDVARFAARLGIAP